LFERSLVQPVVASVEHARVLLRLAGDCDRWAGAGEDDAVGRERLALLDRQPPLVALDLEGDDLTGDDLGLGPLGDLAQVGAPLPVRRGHAAAIDPVRVHAPRDQMPRPPILRHRRSDRRRGRAPAVGVREADVLLRRRPQGQEAVRVPLPPPPVPADGAWAREDTGEGPFGFPCRPLQCPATAPRSIRTTRGASRPASERARALAAIAMPFGPAPMTANVRTGPRIVSQRVSAAYAGSSPSST